MTPAVQNLIDDDVVDRVPVVVGVGKGKKASRTVEGLRRKRATTGTNGTQLLLAG